MVIKTYKDGTLFTGVIGRTTEEFSPAWPWPPRPPDGAPNVLFFVLDDIGYRQLSCFTGTITRVTLDLSGELIPDSEADMKIAMARQ